MIMRKKTMMETAKSSGRKQSRVQETLRNLGVTMRLRTRITLLSLATLLPGLTTSALAQSLTVFDVPNSTYTNSLSINDGGDVTGNFADQSGKVRGFVRSRNGNISAFDGSPTATYTTSLSINLRGDVTGYFIGPTGLHNFLRDKSGKITVFDIAQSFAEEYSVSINNSGDVAGYYIPCVFCDGGHGFMRDRNGSITFFDVPNSPAVPGAMATQVPGHAQGGTWPMDMNTAGDVTGFIGYPLGIPTHGFLRDRHGNVTVFDPPNGLYTESHGINEGGAITGYFLQSVPGFHGFVRDPYGNFTVFDPPGSSGTLSVAINTGGTVTGSFTDASHSQHGFVGNPNANIAVFDPPNSVGTLSLSINIYGDVTGSFTDASQGFKSRGFVRKAN